jgi:hypothetical protein
MRLLCDRGELISIVGAGVAQCVTQVVGNCTLQLLCVRSLLGGLLRVDLSLYERFNEDSSIRCHSTVT